MRRRSLLHLAGAALVPALFHRTRAEANMNSQSHPYVGMWVTEDGHIRHELLPNGRYDEARGARKSAYQGRYAVTGNHIDYWDDTGFTADGDFIDGVLHHGGMILYRAP
ncbi:Atu4866 domain-containing protein [Shinella sp.]|uniref:Atu4866 domain-containing protein n=1 Tax=Shinella sp. TaxID=1870904 RepID=UPI0029BFE31D|nr:Atu4866 domain-containing protein [Shinella sp.]